MDTEKTPGQLNYESYRGRFPGENLPTWHELPPETRQRWEDGAANTLRADLTRAEWGPDSVEYR